VMVFVFHQTERPPLFFNEPALAAVRASPRAGELATLEASQAALAARKQTEIRAWSAALDRHDQTSAARGETELRAAEAGAQIVRGNVRRLVHEVAPRAETNDTDYVFISFVLGHLPRGLVGLLLAVILCAALSSTASELTALGGTTVVDFYKRSFRPDATDAQTVRAAKLFTAGWGVLAVVFAALASLVDNLIQAVNILGSLFYGTILGVFLVALFTKRLRATPVFVAALLSEALVIVAWLTTDIGFLWFNVIGCALVVALSWALQALLRGGTTPGGVPGSTASA
jgi:SSS family solute:Na+ symporter